jgi:iron(III) transport system substrate-binding protein
MRFARLLCTLALACAALPALAQQTLNVYSIWPENWARPMFEEFEKATGIKVNFVRFSSGEALARVIAEKSNPRVDVLFGGPVETFAAGINEGVFEPYKPPSFAKLPARMKQADGQWVAIADDPLVFMTNDKFLKEHNLKAPASWDDLLNPAYKNMLQMADARTSGTAVTRIFSVLEVNGRDENKAFAYMKKLRPERAALHQERRRRHAAGRARPGGRRHLLHRRRARHQGQGLRGHDQLSQGRHRHRGGRHRAHQGRQESGGRQEAHRLGVLARRCRTSSPKYKINFVPAHPDVTLEPSLAAVLKGANIFPIDAAYAGANRKKVVGSLGDGVPARVALGRALPAPRQGRSPRRRSSCGCWSGCSSSTRSRCCSRGWWWTTARSASRGSARS